MERPVFIPEDVPLTDEQLVERETWMMTEGNWHDDHSVPSAGEHYRYMWKWDSAKGIVINARRGDPERAAIELTTLLRYVDPHTGFLPNKIFATADHKTWRDYPEAWNFNDNKVGTSYSQPPLEAWAAMETYESFVAQDRKEEGLEFLQTLYGEAVEGNYTGLKGSYAYWYYHRQNPDSPLLGIVHPNETGRDSDEANKPWLVGKEGYHPVAEWLQMQWLGIKLGRRGRDPQMKMSEKVLRKMGWNVNPEPVAGRIDWIPEQVKDTYWVNDVMFNAMYVQNLRYLADIACVLAEHAESVEQQVQYAADAEGYESIAADVEHEILTRMWDPKKEYFYNLDANGNQIPVDSVTGLFALLLENISAEQTEALLKKLESFDWFNTRYPIPTHAVQSEFYDPNPSGFKNTFTPQWSGTVWTDVNHIIVEEGLVPRAETFPKLKKRMLGRAAFIADQTHGLLAGEPKSMEYYSPQTGKGMRVADFMWTNLGLHFEKLRRALAKNT